MASTGPRLDDLATGPLAASLDQLLSGHPRMALAVSGGSDSVALMYLFAALARQEPSRLDRMTILTVDHRLREGSTAEAQQVAAMARAAGFPRHAVLTWSGPRPATAIQEAAREARYRLICDYCTANGITAFATAHTRDDQAETVLMRLARGSGIDGLAGMAPARLLDGIAHYRPLLAVSRADLREWLLSLGAAWIDDPSNDNPAFERIRWRQARASLDAIGLTDKAVALTARRTARAKAALEWAARREVERAGDRVRISPFGYAVLNAAWFAALPADIRVRIMGPLMEALGGAGSMPPLSALENACDGLCNSSSPFRRGFTLHGAAVRVTSGNITVMREPVGRRRNAPLPPSIAALPLEPGAVAEWDNRYTVALAPQASTQVTVGPLGIEGLARLRAGHAAALPDDVPARVLWTLPALTVPNHGLAVPQLGVFPAGLDPPWVPEWVQVRLLRVPFAAEPTASLTKDA